MLSLGANVGVYLCTEPVDMRRSFDGLRACEFFPETPLQAG